MTNWQEDLNNFFRDKGIKEMIVEFTQYDEITIQSYIEEVVKPAFSELALFINSFKGLKASIVTSKNSHDSKMENIELSVLKSQLTKFKYGIQFSKIDNEIQLSMQYTVPNFYGETKSFENASGSEFFRDMTSDKIKANFVKVFTEHFDKK